MSYLQGIDQQTEIKNILAMNKMMEHILANEDEDVHIELIKMKGKILMALEENVLQHKKRLARQSGRRIFS